MPATVQKQATSPLTLSAAGAARLLGLGKAKTLALIHSGRLPAVMLDQRIRVRVADCEAFIASLPAASDAKPKLDAA